jgi:hypothetical protein
MLFPNVLVYGRSRLSAMVALGTIKIERRHCMWTENTLKRDAAAERLGCVISHSSILVLPVQGPSKQEMLTFRTTATHLSS